MKHIDVKEIPTNEEIFGQINEITENYQEDADKIIQHLRESQV